MNKRKIHWVSESKDKKTGPVIVSYSPQSTCPDSCRLKTGGCYAWGLFYLKSLSNKIESGVLKAKTLSEAIKDKNPICRIVRHRVFGDVIGDVKETYKECKLAEKEGFINIGYTHAWQEKASKPLKLAKT